MTQLFLRRLAISADELMCRFHNSKMDVLTQLGKQVLPDGLWGHGPNWQSSTPSVYLTFDDGPHPQTTPYLLELLESHGIHATFFLIGKNCSRHPELVKQIHEAGHTIGNHSFNHLLLPTLPTKQLEQEIEVTNKLIEQVTGKAPELFRPPFGLMDYRAASILKELEMTAVYWGSVSDDWSNPGQHRIVRRVMWRVADGSLIVLHEGSHLGKQTTGAAGEIIRRVKNLGYHFTKVRVIA
jgi:peptidoglycan-N-acetylglucosamine deacetylase